MNRKPIQILNKDLKEFRKKQWLKQGKKCAILNKQIPFEDSVVDHLHKIRAEEIGKDGRGMIRGVIHKNINQLEGKVSNAYIRYGVKKLAPLPFILRRMADYLEDPPIKGYIHPSCILKIKKKKLSKTDIKRVRKYWKQMYPKRKFSHIPKTITKEWAGYIKFSKLVRDNK